MDLSALNPLMKMIIKKVWEVAIHPELQKLEGQISQDQLKAIAVAIDTAIDGIVESQL